MRIGVLSDTHLPKGKRVLPDWLKETFESVDVILHAGDWTERSVMEELTQLAPVKGVTGNGDNADLIENLPRKISLEVEGFQIGVVHGHEGTGRDTPTRAFNAFEGPRDIIVFGHSHIPYLTTRKKTLLFNPGSPTDKRTQRFYSVGLVEISQTGFSIQHIFHS